MTDDRLTRSSGTTQTSSPTFEDSAERVDVREIHAAIMRERAEPREGREPTPLWLIALMGAVLFWSGFYLQRYAGGFKPLVFDERSTGAPTAVAAQPSGTVDMAAVGRRTFQNTCQACHQESGLGVPGQFPPLAGSEWVLVGDPSRVIRIALDGFTGPVSVKGQLFSNTMVPWRDTLSNQQIAAVLTYIRQAWGNRAPPVTEAQVKSIRDQTKDRAGTAWTASALQQVTLNQ
jgi:mono/diheme cytochrome c family protein